MFMTSNDREGDALDHRSGGNFDEMLRQDLKEATEFPGSFLSRITRTKTSAAAIPTQVQPNKSPWRL